MQNANDNPSEPGIPVEDLAKASGIDEDILIQRIAVILAGRDAARNASGRE